MHTHPAVAPRRTSHLGTVLNNRVHTLPAVACVETIKLSSAKGQQAKPSLTCAWLEVDVRSLISNTLGEGLSKESSVLPWQGGLLFLPELLERVSLSNIRG